MSVQAAMEEMERQQQQGTLGEDELEALAKDVTSKVHPPKSALLVWLADALATRCRSFLSPGGRPSLRSSRSCLTFSTASSGRRTA